MEKSLEANDEQENKDKQPVEIWAVPMKGRVRLARSQNGCYSLAVLGMAIFILGTVAAILGIRIIDNQDFRGLGDFGSLTPTTPIVLHFITATALPTFTTLPTATAYPTYTPQATYTPQSTHTPAPAPTALPPTSTPPPITATPTPRPPTPTPHTIATTLYLLRIPTLSPPRTGRYEDSTPLATQAPSPTRAGRYEDKTRMATATALPVVPPVATPAWTMQVISYEQSRWGLPEHPNGCDAPYNNKHPTWRFWMEVVVTNNADRALLAGWGPRFFTVKNVEARICAVEHRNFTLLPGDTREVMFFTHFEPDDRIARITMDELNYRWEVCRDAAGQWETCIGEAMAALPSVPVAMPTSAPEPPEPFTIEIKNRQYDRWGRPMAANGCDGPYENKDPVRRFTLVTMVTNRTAQVMPEGWKPEFYTARGSAPAACIWNNDSTALGPGETRELTFFTHLEQGDWVNRVVVDTMNYLWVRRFDGKR